MLLSFLIKLLKNVLVISVRVKPILKTHRTLKKFTTKIVMGQLLEIDLNHKLMILNQ
jgi:hypothetical protein